MPTGRREPYQISLRFHRAMQTRALSLEVDALRDELVAATLEDPDQLRRQRLLVQAQRDEADRLRDFLTATNVRPPRPLDAASPSLGRSIP